VGLVVHLSNRVGIYPAADDIPSYQVRKTLMSETAYCYHCGMHHPIREMREILTKAGKRWRCIKSIEAAKVGIAERDAFGRQISAIRSAESKAQRRRTPNQIRKAAGKETL
jgi:hypothetical protein